MGPVSDGLGRLVRCWGGLETLNGGLIGEIAPSGVLVDNVDFSTEEKGTPFAPRRDGRGSGAVAESLGDEGKDCTLGCAGTAGARGCELEVCSIGVAADIDIREVDTS